MTPAAPELEAGGGTRRALASALAPVALCLIGLAWVYWPQWSSGFRNMPALLRDPRLVNYTLEHGFRWLMRYPAHAEFWQVPLFYPQPGVTAYTDVLIGAGPIYWALRWAGAAPDTAFQLWMIACSALNFAAGHALLSRGLRVGSLAAGAGAFLIAFGGPATIRIWHPQLLPQFWVLLCWLATIEVFGGDAARRASAGRRVWIGVGLAAACAQLYTAFYPFFFFGLFGVLALAIGLSRAGGRRNVVEFARRHGPFAALCALVALAAIAPIVSRYWETAEQLGLRPFMTRFAPRPASWFLLGTENYWFGWLQRDAGPWSSLAQIEHAGGAGFATVAVAAVGVWHARHRGGVWIWVAASLAIVALSTLVDDHSLWRWVHARLPGAGAIRVISRITMVFALTVSLGFGLAVDALSQRGRRALAAVVALLCVFENARAAYPQIDKFDLRRHIQALAEQVGPDCAVFATAYLGPPGYLFEDDDAAWVQLATGRPTINGRYGNNPRNWKLFRHQSDGAQPDPARLEAAADAWLARFGLDPAALCWVRYR